MNPRTKSFMDSAQRQGFSDARLRDLGFAILRHVLSDIDTAYKIAFSDPAASSQAIQKYANSDIALFFKQAVAQKLDSEKKPTLPPSTKKADDISFDENKAEIIKSIARLEKMLRDDDVFASSPDSDQRQFALEPKERIAIESQLLKTRTTLSEKFGASEKAEDQYIIVQPNFNKICPHTHRECYELTPEWAMKAFDLIPRSDLPDDPATDA